MTEQANSNQVMPTDVGITPETDDVLELQRKLEALTGQAMEMAGFIVRQTLDAKEIWDRLLPVLNEVQAMLSQHCTRRQERRAIGLPTWERWRRSFLKDSGLNVCDRTAQRRLREFRGLMAPDDTKLTGHSRGTTRVERYQILQALQAANELRDALLEGDDPSDVLANFLATNISSDRLKEMMANCPRPREASRIEVGRVCSGDLFPSGVTSWRFPHRGPSSKCELDFLPGGWSLLAEYISVEHAEHFKAVFATLPIIQKRQVFKEFVITIAKTLNLDEHDGNLRLPAENFGEDVNPLKAA